MSVYEGIHQLKKRGSPRLGWHFPDGSNLRTPGENTYQLVQDFSTIAIWSMIVSKTSGLKISAKNASMSSRKCGVFCMVNIYIPGHEKAYDICVFLQRTLMNLMSTLVSLPLLKT